MHTLTKAITCSPTTVKEKKRDGDDAVVRRGCQEDDDDNDGEISSNVFVINSSGSADSVWKRGQEDKEREKVQGFVRKCEAQEGEED